MMNFLRRLALFFSALLLLIVATPAMAGGSYTLGFTKAFGASSVDLNGSTSLTFRLSTNTGGFGNTGAIRFTDTLPAGLKVATPNAASAITCSSGSQSGGVVTVSNGSGAISLTGMALAGNSSCSFSVNVTGTLSGLQTNTVTATAASNVSNSPTAIASITVNPGLSSFTPVVSSDLGTQPNSATQLSVLDLSSAFGPLVLGCMTDWASVFFNTLVQSGAQSVDGTLVFKLKNGGSITFYPLAIGTASAAETPGVALMNDNAVLVSVPCSALFAFKLKVSPAVKDTAELASTASTMRLDVSNTVQPYAVRTNVGGQGLTTAASNLQINAQGVITATVNGNLYSVRPDFLVTDGPATGTASIVLGSYGVLRFINKAGGVQILQPAFLDPTAVQAGMGGAVGGTLLIQTDASGVFTPIIGRPLLLKPEMVLTPTPLGLASANFVNDRPNHYLYRVGIYYQGFTATPQ